MHLGILIFHLGRWVEGPSSWGREWWCFCSAVPSILSAAVSGVTAGKEKLAMLNCVQIDHQIVWELANILSSIPLPVKFAKVDSVDCKQVLCQLYHPKQNTPSFFIAKQSPIIVKLHCFLFNYHQDQPYL